MKPYKMLLPIMILALAASWGCGGGQDSGEGESGAVLPFNPPPMGGKVGLTMQESVHKWRKQPRHLPEDAPNILIVMMDDAGFGQPSTFGGQILTPTLSRLAEEGISYNAFHTTGMCSPTRAALMTGRNHHRVGAGQIAEVANDWDGYTGVIPKSSATIAEVLRYYGYATAAFGKDHNTPVDQIGNGPYDRTPTGRGFDYFYGFIAGETSQWEPTLWENTTPVSAPHVKNYEDYHLTEDMADKAITWMRRHRAMNPDRPFLMWWTPGAVHGPHHVAREWADKYKGKFSDGWDAYQKRVFERQKAMGWIPADTKLIASDWGGTRTPMVISWPKRIKPDKTPRSQFTHVNDVVPTIYDILGITPPKNVACFIQHGPDSGCAVCAGPGQAGGDQRFRGLCIQQRDRHRSR
jgi:arylsulfatase A-like enzyme